MSNYTDVLDSIKPSSSDDEFIDSVLGRSKKNRAANVRILGILVTVVVGLMALTITAGAVNDWDYPALFKKIFNDNPVVIESMDKDINYEVVSNTFEGLTFEVSAIYADSDSLFLTIDITSDEPVFNESHEGNLGGCLGPLRLGDGFQGWPEFTVNTFSYHVLDEYRMVAAIYFTEPVDRDTFPVFADHVPGYLEGVVNYNEVVASGGYFSIHFRDGSNGLSGFPVSKGKAEIKFTVDAIDDQNVLLLSPDMRLENRVLVKEIKINPFSLIVNYGWDASGLYIDETDLPYAHIFDRMDVSVLLKNGDEIPIVMLHDGGSIRSSYINDFDDPDDIICTALLYYDQLLIIDDIAAILFDKQEILVR